MDSTNRTNYGLFLCSYGHLNIAKIKATCLLIDDQQTPLFMNLITFLAVACHRISSCDVRFDLLCPVLGQPLGITDVGPEVVALVSHATQECLRGLLEKLTVTAEHRKGGLKVQQTDRGLICQRNVYVWLHDCVKEGCMWVRTVSFIYISPNHNYLQSLYTIRFTTLQK